MHLAPPLVEAVRGDDAAPVSEGPPESRLLPDRLRAGVDQARAHRRVLRPGGDETPFKEGSRVAKHMIESAKLLSWNN